jgi:hypothetical protein
MQHLDVDQERKHTSFQLHLSIVDLGFCFYSRPAFVCQVRSGFNGKRSLTTIQTLYGIHYFLDMFASDCLFRNLRLAKNTADRSFWKKRRAGARIFGAHAAFLAEAPACCRTPPHFGRKEDDCLAYQAHKAFYQLKG